MFRSGIWKDVKWLNRQVSSQKCMELSLKQVCFVAQPLACNKVDLKEKQLG